MCFICLFPMAMDTSQQASSTFCDVFLAPLAGWLEVTRRKLRWACLSKAAILRGRETEREALEACVTVKASLLLETPQEARTNFPFPFPWSKKSTNRGDTCTDPGLSSVFGWREKSCLRI